MKKIPLNQIVIKSPGVQIRERIVEEYGSIKVFCEVIDLYESSINQYLSSKGLGSSTFKIRTMNAFGIAFNDLYMSDEAQIRHLASAISWYIQHYNQSKDIEILEKLKKLCLQKELYEDYAIVCRCYAHYYMNQGKHDRAYAYMEVAVNYMRGKENVDRFGLYLSDLIWMKATNISKAKLNKLLEDFKGVVEKVEGPLTKGHMYNNLGRVFAALGDYERSKFYFNKVFKYHNDSRSRALIYTRIGDVEKLLCSNEDALKNYRKAEKLLSLDDDTIRFVYDEYASYYFECGDLEKAEKYTDKIFSDKSWQISSSDHKFLLTFARIKLALKKEEEIVNIVKTLLNEISSGYIYTTKHLSLIDKIVMWKHADIELLDRLNKVIIAYYLKHDLEKDYKDMLKRILGSIVINTYQL